MPTTNDPSTNQNPQTAANEQTVVKPEDNFDFDINLDDAQKPESENHTIDINKEPEAKTESIKPEFVGDNLSIDLPESYTNSTVKEATDEITLSQAEPIKAVEHYNDTENNSNVTEDNSWLKVQDEENKKSEELLFDETNNKSNYNPLNIDAPIDNKDEISIQSSAQTMSLSDNLWDTTPVDINKIDSKNKQFDIEKTNYSNDMKIIEGMTGVKPIEWIDSSNAIWVSLPKEWNKNSINLDMLVWFDKKIESDIKEETANKNIEMETIKFWDENTLYPNLLKSDSIDQDKSDTKKDEVNNSVNISQSLNMELNAISPDAPEEIKKVPNHLIKFVLPAGIITVVVILWYFIWTTMFPVGTGNIVEDAPQIVENIEEQSWINEELTWTDTEIDSWSMSWDIMVPEWDTTIETWHASADDSIDPIWELNADTSSQQQLENLTLVDKIKLISDEANSFLSEWQLTNNKVYIKYGWTISKKCTELVSMLENKQEIDNLSWNLAQLEGYLQKLRDLKNANTWNPWWDIPQEASGQDSQTPTNQTASFTAE